MIPFIPWMSVGWTPERPEESLTGKRIVVVEDEGVTELHLVRSLKRAGLLVVGAAANGQKGLELVLEHHPDLVLMDIRLPILDGLEASRRILEQMQTCIVILTGYDMEEYRQKARELGLSGYIVKPVTGKGLIAALEQAYRDYQQQNTP
ncbi:MAG TPA: response regulator [Chthonomonadaceae bacterium]|nr:response regulator [Chthonomonadaceae bacterium]